MHLRLPLLFRAIAYGLRGGFLIRPFVIALVLGAVGGVLSSLEEQVPTLSAWVPTTLFPSRQDPQVAQVILSAIATSIMTVVSIVFAILLMTLTLASTQFSPRILVSFVRDRGNNDAGGVPRNLLVLHGGTAGGAVASRRLRAGVHRHRRHVAGAGCGRLISQAISVNHIVDRIARETELVIDELMPRRRPVEPMSRLPLNDAGLTAVLNQRSGYIRFVDVDRLRNLANPGASASGWNAASASSFQTAYRCYTYHARSASIRCAPPTIGRLLHRADPYAATGRGVRRHPDRRYRAAGDLSGDQ